MNPEFRGGGTGNARLLHLARIANARGGGRMEWAGLDWNEPAKGFYKSSAPCRSMIGASCV